MDLLATGLSLDMHLLVLAMGLSLDMRLLVLIILIQQKECRAKITANHLCNLKMSFSASPPVGANTNDILIFTACVEVAC